MTAPAAPTTENFRDLYVKIENCRQALEPFQDGSSHVLKCELNASATAWECDIEVGRYTVVEVGYGLLQAYEALAGILVALGLVVPNP